MNKYTYVLLQMPMVQALADIKETYDGAKYHGLLRSKVSENLKVWRRQSCTFLPIFFCDLRFCLGETQLIRRCLTSNVIEIATRWYLLFKFKSTTCVWIIFRANLPKRIQVKLIEIILWGALSPPSTCWRTGSVLKQLTSTVGACLRLSVPLYHKLLPN